MVFKKNNLKSKQAEAAVYLIVVLFLSSVNTEITTLATLKNKMIKFADHDPGGRPLTNKRKLANIKRENLIQEITVLELDNKINKFWIKNIVHRWESIARSTREIQAQADHVNEICVARQQNFSSGGGL